MVVFVTGYALFLTPQYNVIHVLAKFVDAICILFYTHSLTRCREVWDQ